MFLKSRLKFTIVKINKNENKIKINKQKKIYQNHKGTNDFYFNLKPFFK